MTRQRKNLWDAVAPIQWLNWIFGMGIIEFPRGQPRPFISNIYKLILMVTYFSLMVWRMPYTVHKWVAYEKITFTFIWWVNIAVSISSTILSWLYSKNSRDVLTKIAKVDDTLEKLGAEKRYDRLFREIACMVMVWLLVVILLGIVDFLWLKEELGSLQGFFLMFLMHGPIVVNSVVDLTFTGLIRCIGSKLRKTNEQMSEVFQSENFKRLDEEDRNHRRFCEPGKIMVAMGYDSRKKFLTHFIETTKQVHLEIVKLSHDVNEIYCIQILLELGVQLVLVTGSLYNSYIIFMDPHLLEIQKYKKLAALCLWSIVSSVKIAVLSAVCASVASQARKTGRIIRELDGLYTDPDIRDNVQQFSLQLILHPPRFSACGFVRLDNELIRAFFGTISTYLVILIQMSSTPTAMRSLIQVTN